jgi:hypothetical protein
MQCVEILRRIGNGRGKCARDTCTLRLVACIHLGERRADRCSGQFTRLTQGSVGQGNIGRVAERFVDERIDLGVAERVPPVFHDRHVARHLLGAGGRAKVLRLRRRRHARPRI